MAFVFGVVLVAWGLVRVGLLGVGLRQGAASRRLTVGSVLSSATWVLIGGMALAGAAGVWQVALILALAALAAAVAGLVIAWPVHWSRLGDPAAWRGSR